MINLLPPEEKRFLLEARRYKIVFILGFIISIFFLSLALILISINISISSKVSSQKAILAAKEQQLKNADINDLDNKIKNANKNLQNLNSFYQQSPSFANFLKKISDLLPEGIFLDNININPVKSGGDLFNIYLSGRAALVEDVILFNTNLKKEKNFSNINFPQGTWLGKQNFIFNVNFQAVIEK